MKELMESQNSIIFIDELAHAWSEQGLAEGSLDAANILKPALSRGEIQCIGATTPGEYRKSIEKDRSLERRFQAVKVPPPNEADAVKILNGIKERYREVSRRYVHGRRDQLLSVALEPVYSGSFPAGQGHRLDRRSRRAREAAPDFAAEELTEVQKRIKFIVHRMENAIANHCSSRRRASTRMKNARARKPACSFAKNTTSMRSSTGVVGREDIEDVVSRWTGVAHHFDQGRRNAEAAAHRRRATQADQSRRTRRSAP